MKLVIAEKPSVAADIARVLGKMKKQEDYYINDEYIVSSALGHLVELCMPADIDKKYARWALANLPIIPEKFTLKTIDKTKKKLSTLKKLMSDKNVTEVINACDAGREGELIFTYIYEICKCKLPRKRLWFSSMTPDAIRTAFNNLLSQDEMASLQDAARCRSESDWLIGINGTRAITTRMFGSRGKSIVTVGRVQTPTLSMIVDREHEIANFEPKDFWKISANFGITNGQYLGVYQKPNFKADKEEKKSADKADRVWNCEEATKIFEEIKNAKEAIVTDKKSLSKQIAPRLYDLTTLQREANNRFSYPAGKTLNVAQSLYEKHKMITYPRTDSRALPEDYLPTVLRTLESMGGEYEAFAKKVLKNSYVRLGNKRLFDNKQVSDHFAIIPTGVSSDKLNADEFKIYDMIARRFIAAFFPEAQFDVTVRTSKVGEHSFKSEGKIMRDAGWLEVYEKEDSADAIMPSLKSDDEKANVLDAALDADKTRPPARYTEATLLTAMETAGKLLDDEELAEAMKEKGLGTPATRAQIIETLIAHKFVERDRRDLIPTAKADSFVQFLKVIKAEELTSPAMTGDWEYKLKLVEKKILTRDDFMQGIKNMTIHIVETTKAFNESETQTRESDIISPTGDGFLQETFRAFRSKDGSFQIYKTIGNRKFSENEIRELVNNKKIGPLTGFRSKLGKPYDASLYLDENFKVKFQFANADNESGETSTTESFDLSQAEVLSVCPRLSKNLCASKKGGKIVITPQAYCCLNDKGEINKDCFRLSRVMLSHRFTNEEVMALLENGKTPLIEDFVSKRTNKKFSAFLVLDEKGSVSFEFPPRAKKEGDSKSPTKKTTTKRITKK